MDLLNEKDALFDIMTEQKQLIMLYADALCESSDARLRKTLFSFLDNVESERNELFEIGRLRNYFKRHLSSAKRNAEAATAFTEMQKHIGD